MNFLKYLCMFYHNHLLAILPYLRIQRPQSFYPVFRLLPGTFFSRGHDVIQAFKNVCVNFLLDILPPHWQPLPASSLDLSLSIKKIAAFLFSRGCGGYPLAPLLAIASLFSKTLACLLKGLLPFSSVRALVSFWMLDKKYYNMIKTTCNDKR